MAITQKGTTMLVSTYTTTLGVLSWTQGTATINGFILDEVTTEATGDVNPIKDEAGDTKTKLFSDPGQQITWRVKVKSTGGTRTPPPKGTALTYTVDGASTTLGCDSARVTEQAGPNAVIMEITGVKEDSMTYT